MTAHYGGYFFEQGEDEGEDVAGDDLVAAGGGVGAVGLHHAGDAVDVLEQEGKHGDAVLPGEQGVGLVELADVVGAVVGREGDAGEGDVERRSVAGWRRYGRGWRGCLRWAGRAGRRCRRTRRGRRRGAGRECSGRRWRPSLVVLPLMPWLSTR